MAIVYLILALLIAVIAVIFAWQNPATITVTFFAWKAADVPLSLVLLATLAIGILIGWLFVAPSLVKHTIRASSQRKRIGVLERELDSKLSGSQIPARVASPTPVSSSKPNDTDPLNHS